MRMQMSKEMANQCAEQYNAMLEARLALADIERKKQKLMAMSPGLTLKPRLPIPADQQSQVREFVDMNKQAL